MFNSNRFVVGGFVGVISQKSHYYQDIWQNFEACFFFSNRPKMFTWKCLNFLTGNVQFRRIIFVQSIHWRKKTTPFILSESVLMSWLELEISVCVEKCSSWCHVCHMTAGQQDFGCWLIPFFAKLCTTKIILNVCAKSGKIRLFLRFSFLLNSLKHLSSRLLSTMKLHPCLLKFTFFFGEPIFPSLTCSTTAPLCWNMDAFMRPGEQKKHNPAEERSNLWLA